MTSEISECYVDIHARRLNHAKFHLELFKEENPDDIPPNVIDDIKKEIDKRGFNPENLTRTQLVNIMKKLNYRKYYEYSLIIFEKITGKKFPIISDDDKKIILDIFDDVTKCYHQCCPPNRLNFFNYNYVLHRICELVGFDEYLILFPLYKSVIKLNHNDNVWKKICETNYDKWSKYPCINKFIFSDTNKQLIDRCSTDNQSFPKGEDFYLFNIGTFVQETDKIFVSDPSYTYIEKEHIADSSLMKLNLLINDVLSGKWNTMICVKNIDLHRNSELICSYESVDLSGISNNISEWEFVDDIGVDSAQAGIYDLAYYRNNENSWNDMNWSISSKPTVYAGIISHGAVSLSGYGDGFYPVYISKNSQSQVVAIRIIFIETELIGSCLNKHLF